MDEQERGDQQVVVWCEPCGAEVGHWRINAALRICTVCSNEIHEEERIMAKQFTEAERAGIQLQLAQGATVKELAKEMGRSYYTIYAIKQAMPKGLKGKKLEAAPAERYQAGSTLAAENIPAIVHKKWIVTIINRRLDEIRDELVSLVK